MAQNVKSVCDVLIANVKSVCDALIANVKTIVGVDNTAGGGGSNVTYDTSAESTGGTATNTQTISITVAANSNKLLLVFPSAGNDNLANAVVTVVSSSVDGAFTSVGGVNGTAWVRTECWRLTAPTAGAHTLTVTWTNTCSQVYATAISLYNVDQTTPVGAATTSGGSGTGPTGAVTLGADDMAVGQCATDAEGTLASTVGTHRQNIASLGADIDVSLATNTGTGSISTTWTSGNDSFAVVVVPVNGAP